MRFRFTHITFALVLLLVGGFVTSEVYAASGMLSVTPSLAEIDLAHDKAETTFYYKNTLSTPILLSFKAQDFSELEDSGQLQLLEPKDAKNYQYSLSSWLHFDTDELSLNPGEQAAVTVSIDEQKLTKGGHYAAILAEIKQDTSDKQVQVKAIISSLLFVRAHTGHEREEAHISSAGVSQSTLLSFPTDAVIRLQNIGNVDVTPHGLVEIYDPLHHLVAKGIFNEGSLKTLPESIRRYDATLRTLSPIFLPGTYTANFSLTYGTSGKKIQTSTTFYSIGSNWWYVVAITVILAFIVIVSKRKASK